MEGMGVNTGSGENNNASCFARSASLSLSFADHSEEEEEEEEEEVVGGSLTYPDPLFRQRIPEQDISKEHILIFFKGMEQNGSNRRRVLHQP